LTWWGKIFNEQFMQYGWTELNKGAVINTDDLQTSI
jgi:hypothetical protein